MILRVCASLFVLQLVLEICLSSNRHSVKTKNLHAKSSKSKATSINEPPWNAQMKKEQDSLMNHPCRRPPQPIPRKPDLNSTSLWDFIQETAEKIQMHPEDSVLILGNVGSGKTTVALTVTGQMDDINVHRDYSYSIVLADVNHKIGITKTSWTLVPELMSETSKNLFVYDFTGFSRSRQPKEDIVTSFLMHSVTKSLSSARIVLTIQEKYITDIYPKWHYRYGKPEDTELLDLTTAVVHMIEDLDKHAEGIGIIITMVDNYDENEFEKSFFRTDAYVLDGVRNFIRKFIEEEKLKLNNLTKSRSRSKKNSNIFLQKTQTRKQRGRSEVVQRSPGEESTIRGRIKLAQILLEEDKMALFRIPNLCGKLNTSQWTQENKKAMTKLMMDTLKSTEFREDELMHHSVSSDNVGRLGEIYDQLNANTTDSMDQLVIRLKKDRADKTMLIKEFTALEAWYSADYNNFTYVIEATNSSNISTSPKDLGRLMNSAVFGRDYNRIWVVVFEREMKKFEKRMDIIDAVTPPGMNFTRELENWLQPLKNWVSDSVHESKLWYKFLSELRHYVRQHFFWYKLPSMPKDIKDIKTAIGGHIVTEEIIKIYEKLSKKNPVDLKIMWEIINEVLQKPVVQCIDRGSTRPKLVVTGGLVRLSDYLQGRKFKQCGQAPSHVIFLATRLFIHDGSANPVSGLNWEVELGIVSPEFYVWDPRNLTEYNLNGKSGSSYKAAEKKLQPTEGEINDTEKRNWHNKTIVKNYSMNFIRNSYPVSDKTIWDYMSDTKGNEFGKNRIPQSSISFDRYTLGERRHGDIALPYAAKKLCDRKPRGKDGTRGRDGKPAEHGFPGGNFIALTYKFTEPAPLKIMISGGLSHVRVYAAQGVDGEMGEKYIHKYNASYDKKDGPCRFDCRKEGGKCDMERGFIKNFFDDCTRHDANVICVIGGCLGGIGGRGGDGGVLGEGGEPGIYTIVASNTSAKPIVIQKTGRVLKEGTEGGEGGLGGLRGTGRTVFHLSHKAYSCVGRRFDYGEYQPQAREYSGSRGRSAYVRTGRRAKRYPNYTLIASQVYMAYREHLFTKYSAHFPQRDFLDLLDTSPDVLKTFTPMDFAQELYSLEKSNLFLKIKKKQRDPLALTMIPRYQSLATRIDEYSKIKRKPPLSDKDRKFLSLLYGASLNQLRTLKQVMGVPVVVDLKGYMSALRQRLAQYNGIKDEADQRDMVEGERTRYKKTFYEKIEECMRIIHEKVEPQVDEIQKAIDEVTQEFVVAIEKMIEESKKKVAALKKAKIAARRKMEMSKITGPLNGIASMISTTGFKFSNLVGESINRVVFAGENLALGDEEEVRPLEELPPSIVKYAHLWEAKNRSFSTDRIFKIKVLVDQAREIIEATNKTIEDARKRGDDDISEIEKWCYFLAGSLQRGILRNGNDIIQRIVDGKGLHTADDFLDTRNQMTSFEDGLIPEFEKIAKGQYTPKDFAKVPLKAVSLFFETDMLLGMGKEGHDKIKGSQEKYKAIVEMVKTAEKQTSELQFFKVSVSNVLVPFTSSVITEMKDAKKRMENGTRASLRIQKFEILGSLRKLNLFLQDISQSFADTALQFAALVKNLDESMVLMLDLYEYIQQYVAQMEFADFIANLHTKKGRATLLGPEEKKMYEKINLALLGSTILSEWDATVQNFEQWVFPFSNEFQTKFEKTIPDYLTKGNSIASLLKLLVPEIEQWVKDLEIEFGKYKSQLFPGIDNQLVIFRFNSSYVSSVPFHVWKSQNHYKDIRDLFAGLPVDLSITPENTYEQRMSAVKFNIAEINAKAHNQSEQEELDNILKNIRVDMHHSGTSRYLFKGESYSMVGSKQLIKYNFEYDKRGERLGRNNIYAKLQNGDMVLSPYTSWTFQLHKALPKSDFNFEVLSRFANKIDLELVGEGTYVSEADNPSSDPRAQLLHAQARERARKLGRENKKYPEPLHYNRFKTSSLNTISRF